MWCAECGNLMVRRDDGAWHACCNRLGYWVEALPLPGDRWYPTDTYFVGTRAFTFCRTLKWDNRWTPILPKV